MFMSKKQKEEIAARFASLNRTQLKMLHAIGIDHASDIKLSTHGYLYHIIYRNIYVGTNDDLFSEEREKGFVRKHGNAYYYITLKGKNYLEHLIGVILIDSYRCIPYEE